MVRDGVVGDDVVGTSVVGDRAYGFPRVGVVGATGPSEPVSRRVEVGSPSGPAFPGGAWARPEPQEHILQFFDYAHLPFHLQAVSAPYAKLAQELVVNLPRNPERTVALRKLLESKDASVRAAVAK